MNYRYKPSDYNHLKEVLWREIVKMESDWEFGRGMLVTDDIKFWRREMGWDES